MRARRRDRQMLIAALIVILGVWLLATAERAEAAPRVSTSCWWTGSTLFAEDLPDEWSITADPRPSGVSPGPSSIAFDFGFTFTAYFWTRGGPHTALFKPGKQLNDYKPVCVAVP